MSSTNSSRTPLIVGGVLAVAAAAIGGWWFASHNAPEPKPIKLSEMIGKNYPIAQTVEAFDSPAAGAASLTKLRQGIDVKVIGLVEGDAWYQVELPDKHLAYVQVSAIPAASPTATPTAPPAPSPAAAPEASANDEPTIDLPPTTEFAAASEQLSVINQTSVYLAPNKQSPQIAPLKVGTLVDVIAKTKDGVWAWVTTSDNSPAYVLTADLGPLPAK